MIISVTGDPGSGKSTITKKIARELNLEHFYIGKIRRDAARAKGMTLAEYNKYGEEHPETDKEVDDYQANLGKTRDNFIIEGRTSWFLIPRSLKLYFSVDSKVGAERVFKELQNTNYRNEDQIMKSVKDMLASHKTRIKSDAKRYKKYYNIDCSDKKNYDFIINTTNLTRQQVFLETIKFINSRLDRF